MPPSWITVLCKSCITVAVWSTGVAAATITDECATWYDATPHIASNKVHRSVKDFGAAGDGVRDDTAAIQAAIDAHRGTFLQKSPAAVYFPPGVYVVSDTLVMYFHTYLFGPPSGWVTRPDCRATLVLAEGAKGFESPSALKPLIATDNGFNRSMNGQWWTDPVDKVTLCACNTPA